jgi:hypothetical protein
MNKKIITLIGAALIASSVHANHQLDQGLRDGIVGGIIGAIIGNNTGSGDSETGALIGAVTGIGSGVLNRRSHSSRSHPRVSHSSGHRVHHGGYGYHVPPRATYKIVYDMVWIEPVYDYDIHGNAFVIRAGYYQRTPRQVRIR